MIELVYHIWNINIEGNVSLTEDVIIEYLEQSGIVHGMNKKQIDCKELAANIRNLMLERGISRRCRKWES